MLYTRQYHPGCPSEKSIIWNDKRIPTVIAALFTAAAHGFSQNVHQQMKKTDEDRSGRCGADPSKGIYAAAAAVSLQSCPTLCDPTDGSPPGLPSLGFSRQEHWSGLPFPSPVHESERWKWSCSVVSNSSDPMDCTLPGSSVHGIF